MILEVIFSLFCDFLKFLFQSIGGFGFMSIPLWVGNFVSLLLKGLSFFPFEIWSVAIANFLGWTTVHFAWAVIEWLYQKIPFVSIK